MRTALIQPIDSKVILELANMYYSKNQPKKQKKSVVLQSTAEYKSIANCEIDTRL
ncbi:Uncharacterized protein APZ42_002755 [Daphnia magna]|uniref:Uncharacterized protein n=1 Tax=Daphnia magna TaxID=35525 RepID=A0A164I284_9CRUS|nr:Uncharacterized protein APZ42_002755 [Daphnia magna]